MGTEVEYGIAVQGQPHANPMVACSQVVNAYATATVRARRARWDFEEESPLRDARGFDMARQIADPTQLTDEDLGLANVILTNGARLYVDHAHPEYSTPEVVSPLDIVRWDKAGEQVMLDAARLAQNLPGNPQIASVALRAREYLHAHFHENIGLDELAHVCGVDRFRLSRAFKAAFGIAPHGYLIQLRLVRARRLLALGTAPADVASDLGFADQSHLTRQFKRSYGLTPSRWRALIAAG